MQTLTKLLIIVMQFKQRFIIFILRVYKKEWEKRRHNLPRLHSKDFSVKLLEILLLATDVSSRLRLSLSLAYILTKKVKLYFKDQLVQFLPSNLFCVDRVPCCTSSALKIINRLPGTSFLLSFDDMDFFATPIISEHVIFI